MNDWENDRKSIDPKIIFGRISPFLRSGLTFVQCGRCPGFFDYFRKFPLKTRFSSSPQPRTDRITPGHTNPTPILAPISAYLPE